MAANVVEMQGHACQDLATQKKHSYLIEQVIADLVDNSIDGNADNLEIILADEEFGNRRSHYIVVVDDGGQIHPDRMNAVMDFGVEREYDELDLGKFGVGLKSSSLSQAEKSLYYRKSRGAIEVRRYLAQVVHEPDKWVLLDSLDDFGELPEKVQLAADRLPDMKTTGNRDSVTKIEAMPKGTAVVLEDMHVAI